VFNAGGEFIGFLLYGVLWLATLADVVRTQSKARSMGSQRGWMFFIIFFPFPAVLFYWLTEARRRRRMTGEPADTA
jgi:phospholipase D-like protein